MGMTDPVSIAELRHDIDSAKRREQQDRLEAEFIYDPDWDVVAEHLIKREAVADLLFCVMNDAHGRPLNDTNRRAVEYIRLAIEQCAREYAERETT